MFSTVAKPKPAPMPKEAPSPLSTISCLSLKTANPFMASSTRGATKMGIIGNANPSHVHVSPTSKKASKNTRLNSITAEIPMETVAPRTNALTTGPTMSLLPLFTESKASIITHTKHGNSAPSRKTPNWISST